MPEERTSYISVSTLTKLLQSAVEAAFPIVYFRGEISEVKNAPSGHVYFTLKDEESQIAAVMWKAQAQFLQFRLKAGLEVLCQGRPTVYPKGGRLQVVVMRIQPAGEGLLQQKFFELKARLGAEGLFAEDRKKQLPFLPEAVGVVTSGSGAVIHDIMVRIRERMASLKVYLVDVRVQGEGSAQEIADAIALLNESKLVEVIIVGRGGGSLEDLWAFNEEVVVRAVAMSAIPVISAVGHEVDVTLCDLVADKRAPTPTAAAEMVVPKRNDLQRALDALSCRLEDTDRWLQPKAQALDELASCLHKDMLHYLGQRRMLLERTRSRLLAIEPGRLIATLSERIRNQRQRLRIGVAAVIERKRAGFRLAASRLEALSPKRVLERGYAVVQTRGGVLTSSQDVKEGDEVRILLARGEAKAEVRKVYDNWSDGPRRNRS